MGSFNPEPEAAECEENSSHEAFILWGVVNPTGEVCIQGTMEGSIRECIAAREPNSRTAVHMAH